MRAERTLEAEIEVAKRHDGKSGERNRRHAEPQPRNSSRHPLYTTYLSIVVVAGAAVLDYSIFHTVRGDMGLEWILFAALTFITAAFSLKMPKMEIRVSLPDVFIFSSILLFGPAIGALTAAMEGLMGSLRARTKSRRLQFAVFNMTVMSLSAYVAGQIHSLTFPFMAEAAGEAGRFAEVAFSLIVLAIWYFVLNTGSLAILLALEKRESVFELWTQYLSWLGMGYLMSALMAGMLSITTHSIDSLTVMVLMAVPTITYLTYRHYLLVVAENTAMKELYREGLRQ